MPQPPFLPGSANNSTIPSSFSSPFQADRRASIRCAPVAFIFVGSSVKHRWNAKREEAVFTPLPLKRLILRQITSRNSAPADPGRRGRGGLRPATAFPFRPYNVIYGTQRIQIHTCAHLTSSFLGIVFSFTAIFSVSDFSQGHRNKLDSMQYCNPTHGI